MKTPWQIFVGLSKFNYLDGSTDLLEDFAAKCVLAKIPKDETVAALGQYFRQCEEVCLKKYDRGEEIAKNFLISQQKGVD